MPTGCWWQSLPLEENMHPELLSTYCVQMLSSYCADFLPQGTLVGADLGSGVPSWRIAVVAEVSALEVVGLLGNGLCEVGTP